MNIVLLETVDGVPISVKVFTNDKFDEVEGAFVALCKLHEPTLSDEDIDVLIEDGSYELANYGVFIVWES